MLYLVFYDIEKDQSRTKVAKALVAQGFERLQFSVFCGLENPKELTGLWSKFKTMLDEKTDKLYVLKISKTSLKSMAVLGVLDMDLDYLAGDKESMFF